MMEVCSKCKLFVILMLIGLANAGFSQSEILSDQKSASTKAKCEKSYNIMCLKLDILSFIDNLSTSNSEFNLMQGVSLVRETNENRTQNSKIVAELARAFPDSPEKRLNGFLIAKLQDFLNSYSLKFKMLSDESASEIESRKGGGGGFGGGKKGGGLLAMAMMMKGTMMAMGLAGLAALAGKALMTAMMAAMMAAIVGLKSLTSKGEKKTTYEIISKPVYTHSHSHATGHGHGGSGSHEEHASGYGGYGRSFTNSFQLPESVKA